MSRARDDSELERVSVRWIGGAAFRRRRSFDFVAKKESPKLQRRSNDRATAKAES